MDMTFSLDGAATRIWDWKTVEQHYIVMNRSPLGMTPDSRRFVVRPAVSDQTAQKSIELIDIESGFVVYIAKTGSSVLLRLAANRKNTKIYALDQENRIYCWQIVVEEDA